MDEVLADLKTLSDPDSVSLKILSKYSPAVGEIAETMSTQFSQLGVRIDSDTLLATLLGSLGTLMQESIKDAELGTALDITSLFSSIPSSCTLKLVILSLPLLETRRTLPPRLNLIAAAVFSPWKLSSNELIF